MTSSSYGSHIVQENVLLCSLNSIRLITDLNDLLPDDKILDWYKLKQFADNIL